MGKTQDGAIWLNSNMLSPYEFWQFWRNTSDADVARFLKLYTELPLDECNALGKLEGSEINDAKVILANEVTKLLHGKDAANAAAKTSAEVFKRGGIGEDLPTFTFEPRDISDGLPIVQAFVKAGLAKSGKEAKRLISENGAKIDDELVTSTNLTLTSEMLARPVKLSAGKKRHALVTLISS